MIFDAYRNKHTKCSFLQYAAHKLQRATNGKFQNSGVCYDSIRGTISVWLTINGVDIR